MMADDGVDDGRLQWAEISGEGRRKVDIWQPNALDMLQSLR
jgi:hypothetical protein